MSCGVRIVPGAVHVVPYAVQEDPVPRMVHPGTYHRLTGDPRSCQKILIRSGISRADGPAVQHDVIKAVFCIGIVVRAGGDHAVVQINAFLEIAPAAVHSRKDSLHPALDIRAPLGRIAGVIVYEELCHNPCDFVVLDFGRRYIKIFRMLVEICLKDVLACHLGVRHLIL